MTRRPPSPVRPSRRSLLLGLLGAVPLASGRLGTRDTIRLAPAQARDVALTGSSAGALSSNRPPASLDTTIQGIIHRPEFAGSQWGMEFRFPDGWQPVYSIVPDQAFTAASSAKVFTAGTLFSTLGPGYRFRTSVYAAGPVENEVLDGDLVLVASGDLLLSNRIQPDGALALPVPDHSYDLPDTVPVPGDPLRPIRDLARQVAARGIKHVSGRVLVDTSLFQEGQENIGVSAAGPVTVSPMMINDNIVDVTVTPGDRSGAPGVLHISPQTGYVRMVNEVTTVPAADASAAAPLSFVNDVVNPDGTHTVTLTGEIPAGTPHLYRAYYIPEPARFAEIAFAEVLREHGVDARAGLPAAAGFSHPASRYTTRNRLAEHISPPVSEEVKVMLKTSSNVHTVMWIYVDGAIAGRSRTNPAAAYDLLQAGLFKTAGLDPEPPGSAEGEYTSAFFVDFLAYISRQLYFRLYRDALPIMGKDGSLAGVQVTSLAAGHVYAKTGTGVGGSASNPLLEAALAGYIQVPDGRWLAFAEFMNMPITSPGEVMTEGNVADEAMGEIATAVYESP